MRVRTYGFPGFKRGLRDLDSRLPTRTDRVEAMSSPCGVAPTILSIGQGQLDMERRPVALAPFRPDPAAVLGNDALADRQADAGAVVAVDGVQAMERAEDRARLLRA